jgi:hypothetical protein
VEIEMLGSIQAAADAGQWRAAAWMLERLSPERYGRTSRRVEVRSAGGRYEPASPVALAALLETLTERKGREG